jgi:hypothetical protein
MEPDDDVKLSIRSTGAVFKNPLRSKGKAKIGTAMFHRPDINREDQTSDSDLVVNGFIVSHKCTAWRTGQERKSI